MGTKVLRIKFILVFFTLVFFQTPSLRADWPPAARDWLKKYNSDVRYPDGILSSAWGFTKLVLSEKLTLPWGPEKIKIANHHFKKGYVEALLYTQPKNQKAPLAVIIPGIFNSIDAPLPVGELRNLQSRGYHVLLIPSSWSADYIGQGPDFKPGNFKTEAQVVLSLTRSVLFYKIGADHVSEINIIGQSYGGFLTAVILALDSEAKVPLFSNRALILGPPVKLETSLRNLDLITQQMASRYAFCFEKKTYYPAIYSLLLSSRQTDLSVAAINCAPEYFAFIGFVRPLKRIANLLNAERFKTDTTDLSFDRFVNFYTEENLPLFKDPEQTNLGYWLARAVKNRTSLDIKILSSMDDPINSQESWSLNPYFDFSGGKLLLLNWGGHLGFLATREYQNLLNLIFGE